MNSYLRAVGYTFKLCKYPQAWFPYLLSACFLTLFNPAVRFVYNVSLSWLQRKQRLVFEPVTKFRRGMWTWQALWGSKVCPRYTALFTEEVWEEFMVWMVSMATVGNMSIAVTDVWWSEMEGCFPNNWRNQNIKPSNSEAFVYLVCPHC